MFAVLDIAASAAALRFCFGTAALPARQKPRVRAPQCMALHLRLRSHLDFEEEQGRHGNVERHSGARRRRLLLLQQQQQQQQRRRRRQRPAGVAP